MNKNEIFILCLGIGVLVIFLLILYLAKGDSVFILSVFAVAIALIMIGICLYLMNNMLNKLDDSNKTAGTDIGLLKKAIGYIAEDNSTASQYITQFLESVVNTTKEINPDEVKVYIPEELKEEKSQEEKSQEEKSQEEKSQESNSTMIEVDINCVKPKATLNLDTITVSNQVLTNALKMLVNNVNAQSTNINQTVQQVQQIQTTTISDVVNTIATNPTIQQTIFTAPTVQQTLAQSQPIIQAITQSQPIQQIIQNGGNIDLTDIRNSIDNLNTAQLIQGADIIEMDKFLRFVDQTSHYVDEEGVQTTIYNGVDISKLQTILNAGSTVNLQAMQASINSLNNIVTTQGTDLTTIDNYLKFVDQTLMYVDEQGNPAVMYPGIK